MISAPSHDDVHFLKTVYRSSRPVGVYREYGSYRAKVLKRFHLGSFPTERAASVAVVNWYREHYGDDWKRVLASRHASAVQYSRRDRGGYTVTAWVYGRPVDVKERCGRQVADYYPTLEMAKRAFARWLSREFGMFAAVAPVFLYRISGKNAALPSSGPVRHSPHGH